MIAPTRYPRISARGILIEALLGRDGDICKLCGDKLGVPGRGGIAIDHRLALARGGSNSLSNLQLAHSTCNTRKREGRPARQLALELRPTPTEEMAAKLARYERARATRRFNNEPSLEIRPFNSGDVVMISWGRSGLWQIFSKAENARWAELERHGRIPKALRGKNPNTK